MLYRRIAVALLGPDCSDGHCMKNFVRGRSWDRADRRCGRMPARSRRSLRSSARNRRAAKRPCKTISPCCRSAAQSRFAVCPLATLSIRRPLELQIKNPGLLSTVSRGSPEDAPRARDRMCCLYSSADDLLNAVC